MIQINFISVLIATIAQFILGALWYSPILFGKTWMKIMGGDLLSKEEISKMQKSMTLFYLLQLFLTLVTTFVFANAIAVDPFKMPFALAFWIWIGYMVPIQIGSVIWGKTERKYWVKQSLIMIGYQFVAIMLAAAIL